MTPRCKEDTQTPHPPPRGAGGCRTPAAAGGDDGDGEAGDAVALVTWSGTGADADDDADDGEDDEADDEDGAEAPEGCSGNTFHQRYSTADLDKNTTMSMLEL